MNLFITFNVFAAIGLFVLTVITGGNTNYLASRSTTVREWDRQRQLTRAAFITTSALMIPAVIAMALVIIDLASAPQSAAITSTHWAGMIAFATTLAMWLLTLRNTRQAAAYRALHRTRIGLPV